MTSTERLRAVEAFPLKTNYFSMLSFAAQDTSFERPIVAKAESCRTIPFVVSLVKGMFAIHSRPLR